MGSSLTPHKDNNDAKAGGNALRTNSYPTSLRNCSNVNDNPDMIQRLIPKTRFKSQSKSESISQQDNNSNTSITTMIVDNQSQSISPIIPMAPINLDRIPKIHELHSKSTNTNNSNVSPKAPIQITTQTKSSTKRSADKFDNMPPNKTQKTARNNAPYAYKGTNSICTLLPCKLSQMMETKDDYHTCYYILNNWDSLIDAEKYQIYFIIWKLNLLGIEIVVDNLLPLLYIVNDNDIA